MVSSNRSMLMFPIITALLSVVMISTVDAYDPDPLQDFCVAANDSKAGVVFVNGRFCKDPKTVTSDDFFFSGQLNKPGNITSIVGTKVSPVFLGNLPGINTLGISMARIDYAPGGVNPPHVHPRATEIMILLEGKLYVGFISSNPSDPNGKNKLYAKILSPGDVYVFPKGLVQFQYNIGDKNAVTIEALSGQDPGVVTVGKTVFGSEPPVLSDLLTRSFQIDKTEVNRLQSLPWPSNA